MADIDATLTDRGESFILQDGCMIEMPCNIVALRTVDGRLICEMEDGRVIDMTDMFGGEAEAN